MADEFIKKNNENKEFAEFAFHIQRFKMKELWDNPADACWEKD